MHSRAAPRGPGPFASGEKASVPRSPTKKRSSFNQTKCVICSERYRNVRLHLETVTAPPLPPFDPDASRVEAHIDRQASPRTLRAVVLGASARERIGIYRTRWAIPTCSIHGNTPEWQNGTREHEQVRYNKTCTRGGRMCGKGIRGSYRYVLHLIGASILYPEHLLTAMWKKHRALGECLDALIVPLCIPCIPYICQQLCLTESQSKQMGMGE